MFLASSWSCLCPIRDLTVNAMLSGTRHPTAIDGANILVRFPCHFCNPFEDMAPVDFIYGWLIFRWVAVIGRQDGSSSNVHQGGHTLLQCVCSSHDGILISGHHWSPRGVFLRWRSSAQEIPRHGIPGRHGKTHIEPSSLLQVGLCGWGP